MAHPKGGYKNKDGERIPGVTTITGRFGDKGGLMFWAFEQGRAAERGEISGLYEKRDAAAKVGTLAHAMVEQYIKTGKKYVVPEELKKGYADDAASYAKAKAQAIKGFKNFIQWQEDFHIEILSQEDTLVSEKYQYGGSPDAIGLLPGNRIRLLDWKTSNKVYPEMIVQIAAYKALWNENNPYMKINDGCDLCRFSKDEADFAHYHFSDVRLAFKQFKLFRQAYEIDKKLKKRV